MKRNALRILIPTLFTAIFCVFEMPYIANHPYNCLFFNILQTLTIFLTSGKWSLMNCCVLQTTDMMPIAISTRLRDH